MTPWQVLGIEPTGDAKAIKKAYAVLVKKNKPDENPEGFAQLHKAYKQCAAMAKRMAQREEADIQITPAEDAAAPIDALEPSHQQATSEVQNLDQTYKEDSQAPSTRIANPLADEPEIAEEAKAPHLHIRSPLPDDAPEQPAQQNHSIAVINAPLEELEDLPPIDFEQAQQELIAYTEKALVRLKEQDVLEHWRFIEHCDALYDFSFKTGFSNYLLEQLIDFFANTKVSSDRRRNVITYLNQQFDWLSQIDSYEEQWGYEAIAPIFDVLVDIPMVEERSLKWVVDARHNGPIEMANYYARLAATGVDLIIFWLFASLLGDSITFAEKILFLPLIFITLKACLEASPLQGSPGQILFGMKVTNKKGRRINVIQSVWRQLMYAASMAAFKITVWINFFLSGGRLLHDRLSGTSVIKR